MLLEELLEHLRVDLVAEHRLHVVVDEDLLHDVREQPEGRVLLL